MKVRDGSLGVLIFLVVVFLGAMLIQEKAKSTVEYSGETTIRTAEATDTIDARSSSLGPDACALVIRTNHGDSTPLVAPPGEWTAWTVVASHAGSKTYSLSSEAQCDSGVRTQVRWLDARR